MSSAPPASTLSGHPPAKRHGFVIGGVWGGDGRPPRPAGGAYVTAKSMQRLGAAFPVGAIGLLGDDDAGAAILADCRAGGIDCAQLRTQAELPTSSSALATHQGASGRLDLEHFEFPHSTAKILHLASPLQLPRLDAPNTSGQPRWRTLLQSAHGAGLRVSLSLAAGAPGPVGPTVRPLLPQLDYLFLSLAELEALAATALRHGAVVDIGATEAAARGLLQSGVSRWVVVETSRAVFACNPDGFEVWQPHVATPHKKPVHPADALHVLAAGVLLAIHDHWPMDEALKVGVAAAAANIAAEGVALLPNLDACVSAARELGHHAAVKRPAR